MTTGLFAGDTIKVCIPLLFRKSEHQRDSAETSIHQRGQQLLFVTMYWEIDRVSVIKKILGNFTLGAPVGRAERVFQLSGVHCCLHNTNESLNAFVFPIYLRTATRNDVPTRSLNSWLEQPVAQTQTGCHWPPSCSA